MAKNDNPHALRLMKSMEMHGQKDAAERFLQQHPLSKSANAEDKFAWAQQQCAFLTENFDSSTVKEIRMDCACGPELGKGNKLRLLYEKEKDLAMFVQAANRLNQGFSLSYDGKSLYLIYPQCYCSCVKRIEGPLPAAWCDCTLGYAKKMFAHILGKEVQAELVSSVKQGAAECRIRIVLTE